LRKPSPVETAALTQDLYSEEIGERFRKAALGGSTVIEPANRSGDVKVIEDSEKTAGVFAGSARASLRCVSRRQSWTSEPQTSTKESHNAGGRS